MHRPYRYGLTILAAQPSNLGVYLSAGALDEGSPAEARAVRILQPKGQNHKKMDKFRVVSAAPHSIEPAELWRFVAEVPRFNREEQG
ncbi:unnamed protein product [Parascedosporium putredinis]|uniref:Uncharacterized protein n=1 Tax=Parascedosporium putredinis TaxID=1442378 RepID=A0A9P1H739_9PEZI|nr:unnamed protein product [Parascedosporium putredinis]CAI8001043.1 unnamed protein product [Parascedosporium putredinis]